MLQSSPMYAYIPAKDIGRARRFYEQTLGFTPGREIGGGVTKSRGVTFEEYDVPGLKTHNGIATGGGAKSAWFKDPEGNILAVVQTLR